MEPNRDKNHLSTVVTSNNKPIDKDLAISDVFKKDKNLLFIHQKIKKLASAVYIITNFFDDSEPAKWSIRELSNDLLKYNILLSKSDVPNTKEIENRIHEIVLEMISLLEIASFAGLVSAMNLSVLERESRDLLSKISQTLDANRQGGISMDRDFFSTTAYFDASAISTKSGSYVRDNIANESIKDNTPVLDKRNVSDTQVSQSNKTDEDSKRQKLKDFSPVVVKRNKRQSAIINVLKRKKEIMIKDISSIISDCSEKTIQRELSSLVDSGIIKKEGERRWTRYSLV